MHKNSMIILLSVLLVLLFSLCVFPASAASAPRPYTVKAGDNLFRIGKTLGFSWMDLATYNNIANPDLIYPGQVINVPVEQEATPAPVPTPDIVEEQTPQAASESHDIGAMLLYDSSGYTLCNEMGETLWTTQLNGYLLRIVYSGSDRYYIHWYNIVEYESGLLCLDMDGNELWTSVFDMPIVNQITPMASGGVCVFSFLDKNSLQITIYSPEGEKTVINPNNELAEVWHIYSAQATKDGRIWLHCAYQDKGESDRYSALLVLDNEFNIIGRYEVPHYDWLHSVTLHNETGRIYLYGSQYDSQLVSREGFWYALDNELELLHRQDEAGKPPRNLVGLGDGNFIVSYVTGSETASKGSLRVYDTDFKLTKAVDDGEYYELYTDLAGGYYAVSSKYAEDVTLPSHSNSVPMNLLVARYDQNHKLIWEQTFMARDSANSTGFSYEPVYHLVEFD